MVTDQPPPLRGDIFRVDFSPSRGSEQAGTRPAVVISIDSFNQSMPVVVVAAITSKIKLAYRATVILPAGQPLRLKSQILAFQVLSVAKSRLGEHLGHLDDDQLHELDNALRLVWGL